MGRYNKKLLESNRKWRRENPEKSRELSIRQHLRVAHGITLEEYEEILASQGGVCAICGGTTNPIRLAVDHDHVTDKIRGLLCMKCNCCLGLAEEKIERLEKMIEYLNSYKGGS
jgi:DNA-binding transcriptional MerR regulator